MNDRQKEYMRQYWHLLYNTNTRNLLPDLDECLNWKTNILICSLAPYQERKYYTEKFVNKALDMYTQKPTEFKTHDYVYNHLTEKDTTARTKFCMIALHGCIVAIERQKLDINDLKP